MLLPSFEYITLQLSGVRAPATRAGTDGKAEAFAEEAKYFVEQRLLQQDVQVVIYLCWLDFEHMFLYLSNDSLV